MTPAASDDKPGAITVESLLVASVREVKDSVSQFTRDMSEQISNLSREMHQQWSNLPNAYVPRQENRQWINDLITDLQAERADRLRETAAMKLELVTQISDLKTELKSETADLKVADTTIEEHRRSDRWQTVMAVLVLLGLCATLFGIIATHWKG